MCTIVRVYNNSELCIIGGGLGGTRRGALHENIKYSGRVDERYERLYIAMSRTNLLCVELYVCMT